MSTRTIERKGRKDRKAFFSSAIKAKLSFAVLAAFAFFCVRVLVAGSTQPAGDLPPGMQQAIFGGCCFSSMEHVFDQIPSVQSVTAGHSGGSAKIPSYQQVELGITGPFEAVRVVFDPC